jgi:HEAT repeat protein
MSFLLPPDVQKLQANRDISGLIKALHYPFNPAKRLAAAEALAGMPDPRAISPLVEALKDDRDEVAQAASRALVANGEPAVDPLLRLILQKKWDGTGWNYRSQALKYACQALGEIGDPRAISPLMMAAKDVDSNVSVAADRALKQFHLE